MLFALVLLSLSPSGEVQSEVVDTPMTYEDCLHEMVTSPTVGSARWVCEVITEE